MIVDKRTASLSASTRPRAIARSPDRPPDPRRPIEVVVFSKNRACQLEALLRSMARFFEYPHRITVLYTASDRDYQRGYDVLANWYAHVTWKREVDFRAELLRLIDEASERMVRHVMFLVDDIVFTRRFTGEPMIEQIENDDDILAVSLRLGDNISYCQPRGIESGPPDFLDGRRWSWRDAPPGDWDYPMSLDGNIYRLSDIAEKLADIAFCNPNTLEAGMAGDPIDRPYLVCQPSPYLVNLALNLVQDVFDNPHGGIPAEALNRRFLNRFIIDIERFAGREFRACHIEPEVALVRHCRPMTVRPQNTERPEDRASAPSLVRGRPGPDRNSFPVRRRFVTARPDGDGLILKRRLRRKGFRLNRTGKAIWSLCDGQTPAAAMFEALERTFRNTDGSLPVDVMSTLMALEDYGLLRFRRAARKLPGTRKIDLRNIWFYVINCETDTERREHMRQQLSALGLSFEFVDAVECQPRSLGTTISHLKILNHERIRTPFTVLEDDCIFNDNFRYEFTVPVNTDAFYLGVSRFGIEVPGQMSWGKWDQVQWSRHDRNNLRVFNMLGAHAILYLNEGFRQAAFRSVLDALTNHQYTFPVDVGIAVLQPSHLVLTPLDPICHQAGELGGQQTSTETALTEL